MPVPQSHLAVVALALLMVIQAAAAAADPTITLIPDGNGLALGFSAPPWMVRFPIVPAGTQTLGRNGKDPDQREFSFTTPAFYLQQTDCTNAFWNAFPDPNPVFDPDAPRKWRSDDDANQPVVGEKAVDIRRFIARVNAVLDPKLGWLDLPSENEWEYAAQLHKDDPAPAPAAVPGPATFVDLGGRTDVTTYVDRRPHSTDLCDLFTSLKANTLDHDAGLFVFKGGLSDPVQRRWTDDRAQQSGTVAFRLVLRRGPRPAPIYAPVPLAGVRPTEPIPYAQDGSIAGGVPWAHAHGGDDHGYWADLQIGHDIDRAVQRLRWCPAGSFTMGGDSAGDPMHLADETAHTVTITHGFWLADSECTQALWNTVMQREPRPLGGRNPSANKDDKLPVDSVSWDMAQHWLTVLNGRVPKLGARLPTEAEWEYACRAGTVAPYAAPFLGDVGWYRDNVTEPATGIAIPPDPDDPVDPTVNPNPGPAAHPPGLKKPNRWGFADMHGNVAEWCSDWYGMLDDTPATDPTGAPTGTLRCIRGGSFTSPAPVCRCAHRSAETPDTKNPALGFRFVIPGP